jgi:hypothetical protein
VLKPTGSRNAYTLDQVASVRIEQDSTFLRVDSIGSHTELSIAVAADGRFAGTVTAFTTRSEGRVVTPEIALLPLTFGGTVSSAGLVQVTLPPSSSACPSNSSAIVFSSRDLWLRPPDLLRPGTIWSDSSTSITCRDGVPLRMVVRRVYRVEGAASYGGAPTVTVTRTQRLEITGLGSQWGETVRVSGTGTGEMTLSLSARTGVIIHAVGHSTLDLTFTGSRRTQRVQQQSDARIALVVE